MRTLHMPKLGNFTSFKHEWHRKINIAKEKKVLNDSDSFSSGSEVCHMLDCTVTLCHTLVKYGKHVCIPQCQLLCNT